MSDPALDYLESGGTSAHPLDASNDPNPAMSYLESGGQSVHPLAATTPQSDKGSTWAEDQAAMEADPGFGEGVLHAVSGGLSSMVAGFRYATGADKNLTEEQIARNKQLLVYQPRTPQGREAAGAIDTAGGYLGAKEGASFGPWAADQARGIGLPVAMAGAIGAGAETLANVPQFLLPFGGRVVPAARARLGFDPQGVPVATPPTAKVAPEPPTAAERAPSFEINDPQASQSLGIVPEKQEATQRPAGGELPGDQQQARKALAARIGLKEVRTSAITGDGQAAADDFDATRYTDSPMGDRMRGVIKAERQALTDHATGIIDSLGAKEGSNQSTLIAKGKTMATPLDALSDHIDAATTKAYEAAIAKGGTEAVQFPTLEKALNDRTLTNTLLAQGKEGFLKGAQQQWGDFKENNPGGINAGIAEQYRQFLNTLWKTNPEAVGNLKGALDTDMHAHFGESIFGDARQLHQLGNTLLDSPKGVAQISGKDPQGPNRTTAFEDIPDKVANMTGDQFKNLINTYRMMPEELQPQAKAAIAEVQGHMVNRLLDAGTKYETQWNKKGVNTELDNNSENFKTAFADNPQAAAKIKDLKDAGEMLRFNSGYRGAHAQASNMEKSGVGSVAQGVGGTIGGMAGHMVGGPLGIVPGAAAGKIGVGKALGAVDKARTLKAIESRVTQLP